jgi:hypothetical protein
VRGIFVIAAVLGCSSTATPRDPASPPAPEAGGPAKPGPPISLLTSMVVVEECPDSAKLDSKRANREIDELVGPCKKVPGGAAHFSATLLPGGRVELASPSGDASEGIVPTCLLQQVKQLKHKLKLAKPCRFDVKLEQRTAEPRQP